MTVANGPGEPARRAYEERVGHWSALPDGAAGEEANRILFAVGGFGAVPGDPDPGAPLEDEEESDGAESPYWATWSAF